MKATKAIVTGHSRGLGAAIAGELLERGIPVLGLARRGNAELAAQHGDRLAEVVIDLADSTALGFADNSPVKDARVDLELDGNPVALEPHADGEFEATLPEALKPGVVSITATVIAGQDTDLLAGELDLHEPAAETHEEAAAMDMKPDVIGAGAGALVLVLGLIGWAALRKGNSRNRSAGGAA